VPAGVTEQRDPDATFSSVAANIPCVVFRRRCAEPTTMLFVSDYVEVLTGRPASEFVGESLRSFESIIAVEDQQVAECAVAEALNSRSSYSVEYRIACPERGHRWVTEHGRVVADADGRPVWVDGLIIESSREPESERPKESGEMQLRHQTCHDALTGLPARALVLDRVEQMLVRSQQEHRLIGAFLVDLDNFTVVNDSLGPEAGDELLKTVASRFVGVMPATDTVGRLEGDQFVVLAEGVSLSAGPELLAERLLDALREPFHVWGFEDLPLTLSASIGIATNDREPPHDLLRDADIALYQAKARGKNGYVLFKPEMKSSAMDRLELEIDLRTALEDNQFFLLYQPVFDLESVNVCGAEALLRWRHPARGIVGPDSFIPMLEATGMIVPVGLWVLRQACRQAAAWHRLGHQLKVSVNVSMRQLETDEFVDRVQETLTATTLRPDLLSLEVAETSLMRDTEATIRRLQRLKELGVLVAIDDFGTGCSSLAYLRQFPIDALKIDRSFVAAMADSPESSNFIRTLVQLGQALGLETLAEGIEEDWQLKRLQDQRCDFGQGFLFSQPIAPEALEAIMSLETLLS